MTKRTGERLRRELIDFTGIFLGTNLAALALVLFLIPNRIAAGGVSGLAIIFYHLWRWPVGLVILLLNAPLFLVYLRLFGPRYGVKGFFGALLLSVAVAYWEGLAQPLTTDPLLASLYGGFLGGLGMGIAFRYRGNTGGTDLAARIFSHLAPVSTGYALMLIDGLVILLAGLAFKTPEIMLYAIIALAVTGKTIDLVMEGFNYSKGALIISDHAEAIARRVLEELGRGVTGLSGRGLYSGRGKEVLFCVVGRGETARLKELVRAEDPGAFVVIANVHEVLGEGFSEMTDQFNS
ncbi:MAG: YitT family protein [Firmicutes bacterium]|nr:YitT family protein [Bacillota bacterium]